MESVGISPAPCSVSPPEQDLDGHLAVVLEVLGQINRRHATLAELGLERVGAFEGCREAFGDISAHPPTLRMMSVNQLVMR